LAAAGWLLLLGHRLNQAWLQNSESLLIDRSAARFPQNQNGFWDPAAKVLRSMI
jgi:hypothetical protein